MRPRERAEIALCATRLYRPGRNAYQRVLNPGYYGERANVRRFYRALIPSPGLVFDIGANHGRLSEAFLELGHTVVAVEPNPVLARTIRRRYPAITVEPSAVGASRSTAALHIGAYDGHSTISETWRATTGPGRYSSVVTVPVLTLDDLIQRHGQPVFLKIDVEGYEADALDGLSQRVALVSFEYQCRALTVADRCLDRLGALGFTEYARSEGEAHAGLSWTTRDQLAAQLAAHAANDSGSYGDVYAR